MIALLPLRHEELLVELELLPELLVLLDGEIIELELFQVSRLPIYVIFLVNLLDLKLSLQQHVIQFFLYFF